MAKTVHIWLELSKEETRAYAQFLNKVRLSDYQTHAGDEGEADTMMSAGEKISEALAHVGFSPE